MYKRSSLMTGGGSGVRVKNYPKWKKQHGDIIVRMIGGQSVDPPMRLPGDWSSEAECDQCHDFFSIKPETQVLLLPDNYVYNEIEPRRKFRFFCCDQHADAWEKGAEERQRRAQEIRENPL
jgi:hypothetical protein